MVEEPVHLPPSILRSRHETPPAAPSPSRTQQERRPSFTVARRNANELILFDEVASQSWIVYPPRSEYEFLVTRRRGPNTTVVEHHPWSVAVAPTDHQVDARDGCLEHGLHCQAQLVITAAVRLGYDPFS